MALSPPRDLPPRYDIKGGSPRSPTPPISVQEYQQYTQPVSNGSGFYKTVAGAFAGLWISSMLAWWTAFQGKGITRDELRNEMKEYKDSIYKDVATINTQIGELKGREEQTAQRISTVEFQQKTDGRDLTEFKTETKQSNKLVADWMEAQKAKK